MTQMVMDAFLALLGQAALFPLMFLFLVILKINGFQVGGKMMFKLACMVSAAYKG